MSGLVTGTQQASDGRSPFNAAGFVVQSMLNKTAHAFWAKVTAVTNTGALAQTGTVDVIPLMPQLDAAGNQVPASPVYGLTYSRIRATAGWAIIADPAIGDQGICIVCDRDTSSVIANRGPANQGSDRQNNEADGVYLFGGLDAIPTQYLALDATGLHIVTPNNITWSAANTTLDAAGNVTFNGDVTAGAGGGDSVTLQGHRHNVENVQAGGATLPTDPPSPGT